MALHDANLIRDDFVEYKTKKQIDFFKIEDFDLMIHDQR